MKAQRDPQTLGLLAKLVICMMIAMLLLGLIWHGDAISNAQRLWRDLTERPGGPMTFRFFLQPTMALIAAFGDGYRDAMNGRGPYLWTILHKPEERMGRIREGLNSTARILLLGLVMDAMYQYKMRDGIYPGEAVIIAVVLAFIPYLILRGPIARLVHHWYWKRANRT